MKLSLIVVSYNRPYLLERLLHSIISQNDPRWEVVLFDDNSDSLGISDLRLSIREEPRITWLTSGVREQERRHLTRYSVAVNTVQELITGDIVGYFGDSKEMNDNDLVGKVLSFFEKNPAINAGYVGIGLRYADYLTGEVSEEGHIGVVGSSEYGNKMSVVFSSLDACQCYHRREYCVKWPTDSVFWMGADAFALQEICMRAGGFYPIMDPLHEIPPVVVNHNETSLRKLGSAEEVIKKLKGET